MNREIRFRGKDIENGNVWRYGSLIQYPNGKRVIVEFDKDGNELSYNVDPETVGQSIGLFDKNGKEIYEDDIVKLTQLHYEVTGKIVYINTEFALYVPEEDSTYDFFPPDRTSEVIGNIHDNPELLKGGDK